MDINQVRFGNYSIGNHQAGSKKEDNKLGEKAQSEAKAKAVSEKNPDGVMNALNIAGLQNMAQVNVVSKKEVNPADHLSADRMEDIEAMMANFELGVNQIADVLEDEFPGMLSDEKKMALAAQIFAQE
jgi:hypothetical protein